MGTRSRAPVRDRTGLDELAGSPTGGERRSPVADAPDYIARNWAAWERWAPGLVAQGRKDWAERDLQWGLWRTPESELRLLDGLRPSADVLELGCGTAAISAWLARQGAQPVAVDFSRRQLDTAYRLQIELGPSFSLVYANVEQLSYDVDSFDLAISEYGASLWSDPRRWLPEAHRLLRPGGRLVFVTNSMFLMACTPIDGGVAGDRLVRDAFGSVRVEFAADDTVEFHLTHGRWLKALRANGFEVEDLIEIQPSEKATPRYEFATLEWARRWPSEEIWVARKA
jgi:SAM-dependent methyltransferase